MFSLSSDLAAPLSHVPIFCYCIHGACAWLLYRLSSCFPDITALFGLCPLSFYCISVAHVISSRMIVFLLFLLLNLSCLASFEYVLCVLQERHCMPSFFGRRSTSAGTHNYPKSVSLTVDCCIQPNVDPHIGSPVPQ
jgi:hypothetical protein